MQLQVNSRFAQKIVGILPGRMPTIYFLKQAEDYFYNDPELHYLFAEYYFSKKETENTIKYIGKCLGVLPGYFPAINLQRKLKSDC